VSKDWSTPVSSTEAYRRAGGRRHYNAIRQFQAEWRRSQVAKLLLEQGDKYGVQADLARKLGVSEATVSRDIAALKANSAPCPCCGRWRFSTS